MYPRKHDLTYFNTVAAWFAGVIVEVLGPCLVCERQSVSHKGLTTVYGAVPIVPKGPFVPKGPYYTVLIMANGYCYEAIVFEHDRSLGGWLILAVNGESSQLNQALEWTFFQGPPHLARTVQDIEARSQAGRAMAVGLPSRGAIVEGHDTASAVSASDESDYNET